MYYVVFFHFKQLLFFPKLCPDLNLQRLGQGHALISEKIKVA